MIHPPSYHPPNFAGGGGQEERARQSGSRLRPRAETRLPVQLRMSSLGSLRIRNWRFADNALPREAIRPVHDVLSGVRPRRPGLLPSSCCCLTPSSDPSVSAFLQHMAARTGLGMRPRAKPLQISGGRKGYMQEAFGMQSGGTASCGEIGSSPCAREARRHTGFAQAESTLWRERTRSTGEEVQNTE